MTQVVDNDGEAVMEEKWVVGKSVILFKHTVLFGYILNPLLSAIILEATLVGRTTENFALPSMLPEV